MSLARAIETGDLAQLPSRRDEDWRWTDLRGLIRAIPRPSPAFTGRLSAGPFDHLGDQKVSIVNGEARTRISMVSSLPRVVALRFVSVEATAHAASPELTIAPGSHLILLESYEGASGDYISEIDLTLTVGAGGRLDRIVLAQDAADAVSIARCDIRLEAGATLNQTVIVSGAKRQRMETHVSHPGHGASVRLDGLYLLADRRHADITTVVTHEGIDGTTDQLIKGVVRDQARGVFQGRITVQRGADRTDARMGHHALVLSDRAEVDAKPELEIYADDVACAHGNTVGALDEDALFYAQQRGIAEPEARAMLTEAFVGEVVDRIEHEGAREVVRAWVAEKLRGQG